MSPVLYEDNHCLAWNKPAGLLTQGDATGDPSLLDLARDYLKVKYHKPGNVFVGLVHRLDRPVSGVVLLARTSKAAARLSEQFRRGAIEKVYWAIVEGDWPEDSGVLEDALLKETGRNVVAVATDETAGARAARMVFRVREREGGRTWLELRPETGRSHQIRVQLAARGHPILGDAKYGSRARVRAADGRSRIALHARRLVFNHPTSREAIAVDAPVPADWPGIGRRTRD